MGNMQEKQAEMKEKLGAISVSVEKEGISIIGNANKEVTDISIDEQYSSFEMKDKLEDMLIVCVNEFIEKASVEEAKASQSMLNDLMPGMGSLFGS